MWQGKRYNNFNSYMRERFGEKVMKLSLDGGFTCPNRDGSLGRSGCIFCSDQGSGEFSADRRLPIREQLDQQIELLSDKWKTGSYIAYFQNFTNTYGSPDYLRAIYEEALAYPGVVGLAIATRPDCLDREVLDLLEELNSKTFLWIELGLQTVNPKVGKFIRRGYNLDVYDQAVDNLKKRNIRVVSHVIFGLPHESPEDMLKTIDYVGQKGTWGIKIHSLYLQEATDLYDYYRQEGFYIMTREEYVGLVADAIEILPKSMVIHRLTGDAKKDVLVEPLWSADKLKVLTSIDRELKLRDSLQGKRFKEEDNGKKSID